MSEQEERNMVEESTEEKQAPAEESQNESEKKESFFEKLKKPVKPLIGWLIFGGAIALIVIICVVILTNVK